MDKQRMGSGLRRLRRMLDLDQREVGARLGITPQAYSHWENGRTELRASDLIRLSYALGVPLGTLMRFLDMPIEDRVLTQGQWEDSGRPAPTPPSGGWRPRGPIPAQPADTSRPARPDTFRPADPIAPPTTKDGTVTPGYRAA
jgi:transcriptional regulator with XRE-family HTH domain